MKNDYIIEALQDLLTKKQAEIDSLSESREVFAEQYSILYRLILSDWDGDLLIEKIKMGEFDSKWEKLAAKEIEAHLIDEGLITA